VLSENVTPSTGDRRSRKRSARREALLDHADALIDERGLDGLTMTALAEAADYAPASLYTYFPARSALLAALQQRALGVLGRVAADHAAAVADALTAAGAPARPAALAQLLGFSELFLAAPEHHPRELRLQQRLLVTPGAESTADALAVVPAAMAVLAVPRDLLVAAASVGALHDPVPEPDPLGEPVDPALVRTLAWVAALNGALLLDDLTTGLPTTGRHLGRGLTDALLRGWGAPVDDLAAAADLLPLLPAPGTAERPARPDATGGTDPLPPSPEATSR
jgi:AcrR family transcriptional regulator